ncbi:zinc finger BED domain-containing protein RICESLEEPER 3-like [Prosopis cineraria]|uniref:zinc finger BED domain-containing protein RICESLEEPER 3-like n=1 Tax=Prosopis cineraria TaxID=364024 RepID=UPI00240F4E19|nr:zinc finger BED domain-containing protein RICESLEEPER 3-like [Prosopis cineraria]
MSASREGEGQTITPNSQTLTPSSTSNTEVSSRKRKAIQLRSEVWEHFYKYVNKHGETKGKCNYCEREFLCDPKRNGTTALKNHMGVCKKRPPPEEGIQTHLNFGIDHNASILANWKFDQEAIRKSLANMVITDELPFKFINGFGFKHFMVAAQPRFKVPSR